MPSGGHVILSSGSLVYILGHYIMAINVVGVKIQDMYL